MELKQLHEFVTVVKEGTISGAARKLNLSQPPLSAQMKLLEEEFGCLLFERGPRKILLTEAGRLLYDRAVTLLELADVTRKELQDCRDGVTGALRLGVVSSVGSSLLPEWIRNFHEKNPAVRFELFEANTYQLLEQLHAFQEENLAVYPICEEPMLAVGDGRFFQDIGEAGEITLSQLSRLPLILYRRWEKPLMEAAAQDGLTLSYFCRNDDARTTARLADCGLGVGVIPASSRSFLRDPATRVCTIRDSRLASSILAVHGKTARLSAVARLFLSCLQEQL